MAELFLPTLHTFAMNNIFTGSKGLFRFRAEPKVVMANPKEVDFAQSAIHVEYWHGLYCYEKSTMEGECTFPMSEEGREAFLANIEGEFPGLRGVGIGRTVFSGFLLAECFLGKLVAIEVLYGLCGVGQNLDDTVVDANFYVVHNAVLVIYEKMGK